MTLAFDASALCFGALSDRSGRRKAWLVPFVLATSVFSGLSAVAASFTSLLLIRLLNGAGEGPTYPLGAAMLMAESTPERVGRNLGFAQSGVGLIGLALGPLLVTQLAVHTNWRWAFLLASVPSFVLAFVLIRWTREVRFAKASSTAWDWRGYQEALSYRNVWVCVFMSVCLMVALWVMNIFAPLFLNQVDHLSEAQMGYVMSIMGLGAFSGAFSYP
ncbi:MFS transporter [Alicyclobacillus shizuokensis]|uniref:MFS transporter n=1 Tax=Alicyclobacillus shizuokensis TaxID=392014 RepID=UPI0009F87F9A|nr:MFS transporter [Alicyclobacillus shizuokensis]